MFIYQTALCSLFRSNVSYIFIQMHAWLPARYTPRNASVYPINVIVFPMIQEEWRSVYERFLMERQALSRQPTGKELLLCSARCYV
jgi:hypothetical protein